MQRHASIVELKPEKIEEYKRLHANVWPEVLERIHASNIRNYSIFLRQLPDGKYYLFSYMEYVGEDLEADTAAIAADPKTQEWWTLTDPCQRPLPDVPDGGWWAEMEEVFHTD